MIATVAAFMVFLPRALSISPYPHPLLRMSLFAVGGGVMGVLTGILRNETEQRGQLEALVKNERDRLLEMMEEGVLLIDPEYRIHFMNRSMAREFGEGTGSLCYRYLHRFDELCGEICRLASVVDGATERWEYSLADGRTYEVVASLFVDSDGVACQLTVFRNVTQRKRVEMELLELDRLKSELLSNVSYELRSPLTSIKGIISSLLQKDVNWDSETYEALLTGISEETNRLDSLVTDLPNMSKIEAGVWKPEKAPRNISDIVNETLEQQKWVHKDRIFETDLQPGLPEVCADYNQIKQVLINLLENAVAYSEAGTEITINARAVDGAVEVSVSDQGVGIATDDLETILDKFYRGSQRRQRPGGVGLGLAICQALILAHGGRIWAESKQGHDSTFYFRLPMTRPDDH